MTSVIVSITYNYYFLNKTEVYESKLSLYENTSSHNYEVNRLLSLPSEGYILLYCYNNKYCYWEFSISFPI